MVFKVSKETMVMKEKCIIFGASGTGKRAYQLLKQKYEVLGFSDNDSKKWGKKFCGRMVFEPAALIRFESVIIIASVYYAMIQKQLVEMGIDNIKVFSYRIPSLEHSSGTYQMFDLNGRELFQGCIVDMEHIEKIEKNFSENYHLDGKKEIRALEDCNRKKVLCCAYFFPPMGEAGVQRPLKFVKYLRNYGYEPIVLTAGSNNSRLERDNSLLAELPEDIMIIRIDNNESLPELLPQEQQQEIFNLYLGVAQSESWMRDYLQIIRNKDARLIPDKNIIWVNECLKYLEKYLELKEIDIVYTTGSPFSSFILGYYLKKKYGMKWVQDYRDLWMSNRFYLENYFPENKRTKKLQMQLEQKLVEASDAILVVGETLKQDFNIYNIPSQKIYAITNGYDEADFKDINVRSKGNKYTICYNGMIYIDRNPEGVLIALNQLIEEKKIESDSIRWVFNGNLSEKWEKRLKQADVYHIIQYNGYLPHLESLDVAVNSDLLLLCGAHGEGTKIVYTGKVFEYLRMGVPILSLSTNGGVLGDLLDETQAGKNFEYDDIEGIKLYLLEQYRMWKANDVPERKVNEEAIQKYSRESTTEKLAEVFDSLLNS